jgi:hypothetical protein
MQSFGISATLQSKISENRDVNWKATTRIVFHEFGQVEESLQNFRRNVCHKGCL